MRMNILFKKTWSFLFIIVFFTKIHSISSSSSFRNLQSNNNVPTSEPSITLALTSNSWKSVPIGLGQCPYHPCFENQYRYPFAPFSWCGGNQCSGCQFCSSGVYGTVCNLCQTPSYSPVSTVQSPSLAPNTKATSNAPGTSLTPTSAPLSIPIGLGQCPYYICASGDIPYPGSPDGYCGGNQCSLCGLCGTGVHVTTCNTCATTPSTSPVLQITSTPSSNPVAVPVLPTNKPVSVGVPSKAPVKSTGTPVASGSPVTLSSGSPVALSSGSPVALSSGSPVALSSDSPVALSSDSPVALSSGSPVALSSGSPVVDSGSGSPVVDSGSSSPVALSSGSPVALSSGSPVVDSGSSSPVTPTTVQTDSPTSSAPSSIVPVPTQSFLTSAPTSVSSPVPAPVQSPEPTNISEKPLIIPVVFTFSPTLSGISVDQPSQEPSVEPSSDNLSLAPNIPSELLANCLLAETTYYSDVPTFNASFTVRETFTNANVDTFSITETESAFTDAVLCALAGPFLIKPAGIDIMHVNISGPSTLVIDFLVTFVFPLESTGRRRLQSSSPYSQVTPFYGNLTADYLTPYTLNGDFLAVYNTLCNSTLGSESQCLPAAIASGIIVGPLALSTPPPMKASPVSDSKTTSNQTSMWIGIGVAIAVCVLLILNFIFFYYCIPRDGENTKIQPEMEFDKEQDILRSFDRSGMSDGDFYSDADAFGDNVEGSLTDAGSRRNSRVPSIAHSVESIDSAGYGLRGKSFSGRPPSERQHSKSVSLSPVKEETVLGNNL